MFKEAYTKSLQMINLYNIKDEIDYNKLAKEHLLLNSESMKYISQKEDFTEVIQLSKAVI